MDSGKTEEEEVIITAACGCIFTLRPYFTSSMFSGHAVDMDTDHKICNKHNKQCYDMVLNQLDELITKYVTEVKRHFNMDIQIKIRPKSVSFS
jgi:hypothetical protein